MRTFILLLFSGVALLAQSITTTTASHIRYGAVTPATCNPLTGDVYFKNTATIAVYYCDATNHWTALGGGGGGGVWGSITGTLSDQTDLNTALGLKAPLASPTFTGTVTGTFSGNITGNVTGNASGSAATVTSITTHASTELSDTASLAYLANTNAFTGSDSFSKDLILSGTLSPTVLSGDVNDYNPTSCSTSLALRIDGGAADRNITGLACGTPADGRMITITNIGATNNLVIKNQSSSSTAANRFLLPADTTLPIDTALAFRYDGTTARWRPWSRALSNTGVSAGTYQSVTVDVAGRVSAGAARTINTTSPVTGGGVLSADLTIACATCVISSSPGAGIAHFAGSTQAVTSSAVVNADLSGLIGLAHGGVNLDLTATGGTSQVLKQTSAGGAITVARLACSDLSDSSATCATAGATTALSNLASVSINSALGFQTGIAVGTTTNPASNIVFNASGTYGTGSFTFAGTPTANRTITLPDASATVATQSSFATSSCLAKEGGTAGQVSCLAGSWNNFGNSIMDAASTASASIAFSLNSSGEISLKNTGLIDFTSTSALSGSIDTSIHRGAAGVVDIGNGSSCSTASNCRDIKVRTHIGGGSAPTVDATSCTGATIGTGSTNTAGTITGLPTSTCSVIITFSGTTAPTGWACGISDKTTGNLFRQSASSTTTATFAGTSVSGDVLSYGPCAAF